MVGDDGLEPPTIPQSAAHFGHPFGSKGTPHRFAMLRAPHLRGAPKTDRRFVVFKQNGR
jgi:hypothetical protein